MAEVILSPNEVSDDALPAPGVARWSPKRKEAVVEAVRSRKLTVEEVCRRYALSEAELAEWLNRHAVEGRRGLAVTKR